MSPDVRVQLEALGRELTPVMLGGTRAVFAALGAGIDMATRVIRDLSYGPDPRHRLDLFARDGVLGAPVLVFVHGGGFVGGDKHTQGSPFYSNVGNFAARQGWVGVTITYRLAPAHTFPSGIEDMALAVRWLRDNIARHGGDPHRIVLCGQSAGAGHVAGYLADDRFHVAAKGGIAGAVMMSGVYDTRDIPAGDFRLAYYGDDRSRWEETSMLDGLIRSDVPQLYTISELDPQVFGEAAAQLAAQWARARGEFPRLHYLPGHNHLSPAIGLGAAKDIEAILTDFVVEVTS